MRAFTQFVFFFSSRSRHTRLVSDWSSDVCSSDLRRLHVPEPPDDPIEAVAEALHLEPIGRFHERRLRARDRQEEHLLVQDVRVLEVVEEERGDAAGVRGEEHRSSLRARRLLRFESARNVSSGIITDARCAPRRRRPAIHVVKRTKTPRPMQNGTHPPSMNLRKFAVRKARSTARKNAQSGTALASDHPQPFVNTTKYAIVVTVIV